MGEGDFLYSIRKQLFDIRVAGISVLVFVLSVITFIEVANAKSPFLLAYRSAIFLLILFFGLLLLGAAVRELKQQEQIEKLARDVQRSYELEIKAYQVEKQAREQLENLDKTKNQFLLLIQHNLRTPLTSMMGYSDLLLNGTFGKQNKKTTDVVKKFQISTKSLIKMVNDFLDITQFQLGKDVLTMTPGIALEDILQEIVTELQEKADAKGIYLKLQKPEQHFAIKADREKLKAAITNIIDNSIKYTPTGGVDIKVKNHDTIKIIISDTGIGISSDNLKTLFSRIFERGDQAKKAASGGSGIGLYLAGQIIRYHNGKVWAESGGEGKGSVFYVELPVALQKTSAQSQTVPAKSEDTQQTESVAKNL